MTENDRNVGVIILAAGASSRLGKPKQLLRFEEKTLVRRAADAALESDCWPLIIVLGANFEPVKKELDGADWQIVFNELWPTGMSSSIRTGLSKLEETAPGISGAIISLCDQPLISSEHFNRLKSRFFETGKPVIASRYNETSGVPALFARGFFPALLSLDGERGAREIIMKNPDSVETINLPEAARDIDTLADFEKLKNYET